MSPEALPHPASPNPQSSFLTPVSASTLTLTSLEPSPCLVIPRETLILLSCHPFLMTKATVYSSKGLSSCTFLTRLSPGPFPYIRCFYSNVPALHTLHLLNIGKIPPHFTSSPAVQVRSHEDLLPRWHPRTHGGDPRRLHQQPGRHDAGFEYKEVAVILITMMMLWLWWWSS